MICPMVEGKRVAIPVNSPEVYSTDKEGDTSNITGGCADKLSHQVVQTIKAENFYFKDNLASKFQNTLHRELDIPIDPVFSEVIRDPSHLVNLGILDVKEDKVGSSGNFLNLLVLQSKNIHAEFKERI